jgi:hypothetical protein
MGSWGRVGEAASRKQGVGKRKGSFKPRARGQKYPRRRETIMTIQSSHATIVGVIDKAGIGAIGWE